MRSLKRNTRNKPCIAMITAPEKDAIPLAKKLIESKVAACVNICKNVKSIYVWEGSVVEDTESILIAKTFLSLKEKFKSIVLENHPYDTPEIIFLKLEDIEARYLYWMREVLIS
ncbi:CutA1 divalent ion tolerance protein [Thermodesulfobium narugense DSM 14796]|uniref:CutA1 divalent ion tolerance protein n=1 Tax=Thermodesulfobium narugense DSM 14796 TaxID=747365 RepID=M1E499_9BACT|nr:divalent-cation tolerance protein CutA [Thermodesulfobium narugense]AEE13872.1 CutA1 divalent ion tolerance protein [Thermodesulfobium narugense DSM 14796]